MAVKFTPTYTNKTQYLYDLAKGSDLFDQATYDAFVTTDPDKAALQLNVVAAAKNASSQNFIKSDFDILSGTDEQTQYLYNEYLQDRTETAKDPDTGEEYNVYARNKEYLDYKIQEAKDLAIYNSMSGFEKFVSNVGAVFVNAATSLYGTLEGIIDAGALLYGTVTGKDVRGFISKDVTGVGEQREYLASLSRKYTSLDKSKFWKFTNDITSGIAQMAPLFIPYVGQAAYFGGMAGRTAEEAVKANPNISMGSLLVYTGAVTGVEFATEKISSSIFKAPNIIDKFAVGASAAKHTGNWLKTIGIDFLSEGFEESVSEFANSVLYTTLVDKDTPLASMSEILYAGLIGGVIGGVMSGSAIAGTQSVTVTKDGQLISNKQIKQQGLDIEGVKLSKLETRDFRATLEEAAKTLKSDAVQELLVEYSKKDPSMTLDKLKSEHAVEYKEAVEKNTKIQTRAGEALLTLSKIFEAAGEKTFIKAAEIAEYTIDKQNELIRRYTEYTPNRIAKLAVNEALLNRKFPGTKARLTETLSKTQLEIRDAFKKLGIDLYYAQYGEANGLTKDRAVVIDENTVVLDADMFENKSLGYVLDIAANQSLVQTLQTTKGVLDPSRIALLNNLLLSKPNYDTRIMDKHMTESVEKLTDAELNAVAEQQKTTISQLLLFDEISIGKVFRGDVGTFRKIYTWLKKTAAFFRNFGRKDDFNKIKYNRLLKTIQSYENSMAENSPNTKYLQKAMKYIGVDDEAQKRIMERFVAGTWGKLTKTDLFVPDQLNVNRINHDGALKFLNKASKTEFSFSTAFDINAYSDDALSEMGVTRDMSLIDVKRTINDYLKSVYGVVIDVQHQQIAYAIDFDNLVDDVFSKTMDTLRYMPVEVFTRKFLTLADVFSDDAVKMLHADDGTTLDAYALIVHKGTATSYVDMSKKEVHIYTNINDKAAFSQDRNAAIKDLIQSIYHEAQHIVTEWYNMYMGGSVVAISDSLRNNPVLANDIVKKCIKEFDTVDEYFEYITSDEDLADMGYADGYEALAEVLYRSLIGETIAENTVSEALAETTYFDVTYDKTDIVLTGHGDYNFTFVLPGSPSAIYTRELTSKLLKSMGYESFSSAKLVDDGFSEEFIQLLRTTGSNPTKKQLKEMLEFETVGSPEATNKVIEYVYDNNKTIKTRDDAYRVLFEADSYGYTKLQYAYAYMIKQNKTSAKDLMTEEAMALANQKAAAMTKYAGVKDVGVKPVEQKTIIESKQNTPMTQKQLRNGVVGTDVSPRKAPEDATPQLKRKYKEHNTKLKDYAADRLSLYKDSFDEVTTLISDVDENRAILSVLNTDFNGSLSKTKSTINELKSGGIKKEVSDTRTDAEEGDTYSIADKQVADEYAAEQAAIWTDKEGEEKELSYKIKLATSVNIRDLRNWIRRSDLGAGRKGQNELSIFLTKLKDAKNALDTYANIVEKEPEAYAIMLEWSKPEWFRDNVVGDISLLDNAYAIANKVRRNQNILTEIYGLDGWEIIGKGLPQKQTDVDSIESRLKKLSALSGQSMEELIEQYGKGSDIYRENVKTKKELTETLAELGVMMDGKKTPAKKTTVKKKKTEKTEIEEVSKPELLKQEPTTESKKIKLYHGTDAVFDKFDASHFGEKQGKSNIPGVYLTTDSSRAGSYGKYVREVEVDASRVYDQHKTAKENGIDGLDFVTKFIPEWLNEKTGKIQEIHDGYVDEKINSYEGIYDLIDVAISKNKDLTYASIMNELGFDVILQDGDYIVLDAEKAVITDKLEEPKSFEETFADEENALITPMTEQETLESRETEQKYNEPPVSERTNKLKERLRTIVAETLVPSEYQGIIENPDAVDKEGIRLDETVGAHKSSIDKHPEFFDALTPEDVIWLRRALRSDDESQVSDAAGRLLMRWAYYERDGRMKSIRSWVLETYKRDISGAASALGGAAHTYGSRNIMSKFFEQLRLKTDGQTIIPEEVIIEIIPETVTFNKLQIEEVEIDTSTDTVIDIEPDLVEDEGPEIEVVEEEQTEPEEIPVEEVVIEIPKDASAIDAYANALEQEIEALRKARAREKDPVNKSKLTDELMRKSNMLDAIRCKDWASFMDLRIDELAELDENQIENQEKIDDIYTNIIHWVTSELMQKEIKALAPTTPGRFKFAKSQALEKVTNILSTMNSFRYLAMLSSPKTWFKNTFGNTMVAGTAVVEDLVGGGLEKTKLLKQDGQVNFMGTYDKEFGDYVEKHYVGRVLEQTSGAKYTTSSVDKLQQEYAKATDPLRKSKILSKIKDFEDKMLSDAKWTRKRSMRNLKNMLAGAAPVMMIQIEQVLKNKYFHTTSKVDKADITYDTLVEKVRKTNKNLAELYESAYKGSKLATLKLAEEVDIHLLDMTDPNNIVDMAIYRANKLLFKTDNWLTKTLAKSSPTAKLIVSTLIPFARTTVNTTAYIIDRSPIGILKGIWKGLQTKSQYVSDMRTAISDYYKSEYAQVRKTTGKKFNAEEYRKWLTDLVDPATVAVIDGSNKNISQIYDKLVADGKIPKGSLLSDNPYMRALTIEQLSQGAVGTALMALGCVLAAITGAFDYDDDDDYLGAIIKIGDLKIKLDDIAPFSTMFSLGAILGSGKIDDKLKAALDAFADASVLGVIDSAISYSPDVKSWFENQIINFPQQFAPAITKNLTKVIYGKKDKSGSFGQKFLKTTASNSLLFGWLVPNKINPYTGDSQHTYEHGWWEGLLNQFLPVGFRVDNKTELEKLASSVGAKTTGLSGSFTINGQDIKISNSRKESLAKYRADYIKQEYDKMKSGSLLVTVEDENGKRITTSFNKLTEEQQSKVLKNLYSKATEVTKIKYWLDSGNVYYTSNRDEYNKLRLVFDGGVFYNAKWNKSKFVTR